MDYIGLATLITAAAAAFASVVGSITAVIVSLRNARKIEEVHLAVNSRLSELLALTERSARAQGALAATEQRRAQSPPIGS